MTNKKNIYIKEIIKQKTVKNFIKNPKQFINVKTPTTHKTYKPINKKKQNNKLSNLN